LKYCEKHFPMIKPIYHNGKYTGTKLEQLKAIKKNNPKVPIPELEYETPCDTIGYLLNIFWDMKKDAEKPLNYNDVKAYSELMQCNFKPVEVEVLMSIDMRFHKYYM